MTNSKPDLNKQKTGSSEQLVRENANSPSHKSDVKVLKDQNKETKDSDHKDENAANAESTSGHFRTNKEQK